jgi:hypothetical protein
MSACTGKCGPIPDNCGGLVDCPVACPSGQICGGGGPSVCGSGGTGGDAGPCTNLCMKQQQCDAGGTTSLSGTVFAPTRPDPANGVSPDPLPNVVIYVPNCPVQPFTKGVSCNQCGADVTGCPLVQTQSAPDGSFKLTNVPVGTGIPVVFQLGRWRRQITVDVPACVDTKLTAEQARLPRNHTEGDIPLTAMVTGKVDSLECVLRKMGVDDTEFTNPSGGGRIQLYQANGAVIDQNTPDTTDLTNQVTTIDNYDQTIFACEGGPNDKTMTQLASELTYANAGGRIFATHYSYTWLYSPASFQASGDWSQTDQKRPNVDTLIGNIDTSFPKGQIFAEWLGNVKALSNTSPPQITIQQWRHDIDTIKPPSQRWIYNDNAPLEFSGTAPAIEHFTFNTPIGVDAAKQCGRVIYSDFHVANANDNNGVVFPNECDSPKLSCAGNCPGTNCPNGCAAQCVQDPTQQYCQDWCAVDSCQPWCSQGGQFPFFCSGDCTRNCPGQDCPRFCSRACNNCGDNCPDFCPNDCLRFCPGTRCPAYCALKCDGTSNTTNTCPDAGPPPPPAQPPVGALTPQEKVLEYMLFDLGNCISADKPPPPPMCTKTTCGAAGATCGAIADGCGGVLQCGTCGAGQACVGNPPKCVGSGCTPATCASTGAQCGAIGDGCGNVVQCGACQSGQICEGLPGKCVPTGCKPSTCAAAGATCGQIGDGCGGSAECGTCATNLQCGGGGANKCGTTVCTATTCAKAGATCGPIGDGCGNLLNCGVCTPPATCGGGGVPNQCGGTANTCKLTTCQLARAQCGQIADGCGGLLNCGPCPPGESCGGGGVPNKCGGTGCVPRTCAAAGANCGPTADGCGGLIDCGHCTPPETCGGNGTPNQCGTPPLPR